MTDPLLLTTAEACRVINVGKTKLFELLRNGELESVRIGSARLIPVDACHALIDRLRQQAPAVEQLVELIDASGRLDVDAIPPGTTLADLEAAKRLIAARQEAA